MPTITATVVHRVGAFAVVQMDGTKIRASGQYWRVEARDGDTHVRLGMYGTRAAAIAAADAAHAGMVAARVEYLDIVFEDERCLAGR